MVASKITELLDQHVALDVEGIDRIYLNGYQPRLQYETGIVGFFKHHRGQPVVSSSLMGPMSSDFVRRIEQFAQRNGVEVVAFEKGQRKDDIAQQRLRDFQQKEGVVFIGKAQEKFSTFRTRKRYNQETGKSYPWIYRSTVMCNQYYFYILDRDFGPLFIKFSSYFPYTMRICLNGHEYAKRQLDQRGIAYEALDNGFLSCEAPDRLQRILRGLSVNKIDAMIRKWLARLPHPFTRQDRAAGYRYDISVLQIELARTQVFDRPVRGREFFEHVIRENLDLGRPSQVSLIFDRRVTRRTPGKFRTRVITEGVIPSLHVSYKSSKIKQYFKEGRALRTETTIQNTRDFGIGRRLENLPAMCRMGFTANRRLLGVQRLSHDCFVGQERFAQVSAPQVVDGQRASALRFGEPRTMALLAAMCRFGLHVEGFRNRDLRKDVAQLRSLPPESYRAGAMTYDLRRLRLHGLIERIPKSQRYRVTSTGLRVCLFFTRVHSRLLSPGLSDPLDQLQLQNDRQTSHAIKQIQESVQTLLNVSRLAA